MQSIPDNSYNLYGSTPMPLLLPLNVIMVKIWYFFSERIKLRWSTFFIGSGNFSFIPLHKNNHRHRRSSHLHHRHSSSSSKFHQSSNLLHLRSSSWWCRWSNFRWSCSTGSESVSSLTQRRHRYLPDNPLFLQRAQVLKVSTEILKRPVDFLDGPIRLYSLNQFFPNGSRL